MADPITPERIAELRAAHPSDYPYWAGARASISAGELTALLDEIERLTKERDALKQHFGMESAVPLASVEGLAMHPKTRRLVEDFALALASKLARAELKYGYRDNWLVDDWRDDCQRELLRHVEKGDPLDVAAYAAFCWARGWPTYGRPETWSMAPLEREELLSPPTELEHLRARATAAETARLKAEQELAEAREALKPFADVVGESAEELRDEDRVVVKFGPTTHYALAVGHFRRAARAAGHAEESA